jgi:hypothetical protein
MSKYPAVDAAAKYLWSKNGQEAFQIFFQRHAPLFVDAPQVEQGGEQDLEFYALFQKYLKLYEDELSGYIETIDCSEEEFSEQLRAVKEDPNIKDKKLVHFVNYLIGCTDYPAFYKMMVRAAKKLSSDVAADKDAGESKAESKGSKSSGRGSKEDDDDDEGDAKSSRK